MNEWTLETGNSFVRQDLRIQKKSKKRPMEASQIRRLEIRLGCEATECGGDNPCKNRSTMINRSHSKAPQNEFELEIGNDLPKQKISTQTEVIFALKHGAIAGGCFWLARFSHKISQTGSSPLLVHLWSMQAALISCHSLWWLRCLRRSRRSYVKVSPSWTCRSNVTTCIVPRLFSFQEREILGLLGGLIGRGRFGSAYHFYHEAPTKGRSHTQRVPPRFALVRLLYGTW